MSIWVSVQTSTALFLTWEERRAAQIAGCCLRNLSTLWKALFHLMATSVFNLWSGNCSSLFFSSRAQLAVVIHLILLSRVDTESGCRIHWRICAKHWMCLKLSSCAVRITLAALWVTITRSVVVRCQSSPTAWNSAFMYFIVLLNYFSLYNRRLELPVICAQGKVKTGSLCSRISGDCYFGGSPQGFPDLFPCFPASSQLSELKVEEIVQFKWAQLCESFIQTLLDGHWSRFRRSRSYRAIVFFVPIRTVWAFRKNR